MEELDFSDSQEINLSDEEYWRLIVLLRTPQEPTQALIDLFKNHKGLIHEKINDPDSFPTNSESP